MTAMLGAAKRFQSVADRYSGDAVATASPARLIVMLYDRLVLDLGRAHQALDAGLREPAHENLIHAQDIVAELLSSLDIQAWDGAADLARIYQWLLAELVAANVRQQPQRVADCLAVVQPLRDTWSEAITASGVHQQEPLAAGLTG